MYALISHVYYIVHTNKYESIENPLGLPQNMDLMIEYESSCSAFQDHYRSVHEIFIQGYVAAFSHRRLSQSYRRYRGRRR